MVSDLHISTRLRSAADWPQWLDQAKAAVKLQRLEEYVDLEGTRETKDITEPDEPQMPDFPEGENVTQAQWKAYDRLMIRYQAEQNSYFMKMQEYHELEEKHAELLFVLQQSISHDVCLQKSLVAAGRPATLVAKVKDLLRIEDNRTIRGFEEK